MATAGTYEGVAINPGTDAQVQSQIAAIDTKGTTPTAIAPISVSSLNTPQAPAKVTAPAPTNASTGLGATLGAQADQFQASLDATAANTGSAAETSLQDYIKSSLGSTTKSELTNQKYSATVDPAQAELQDINNQILADQVATRHQIEELRKNNPQGLYGGALEQKIQDIQDKSTSRQADLAVVQLAKQGKYDSAKAIADRAVEAQFERQQANNDALKFMYEQNKSLFDKADQRAFETAQKTREDNLAFEKQKKLMQYEQTIKQSDPLYQAQLRNANASGGTKIVKINGTDYVENADGTFSLPNVPGGGVGDAKNLAVVNSISNVLSSPAFNNVFGLQNIVGRNIPGTQAYQTASEINQIQQQLALAARGQLKGQGAVSDFEGKLLRDSQTALKLNLSPEQARHELTQVQGAIRTSSGLDAQVQITDPNTGKTAIGMADQAGISAAIAQGARVKYVDESNPQIPKNSISDKLINSGKNALLNEALGPIGPIVSTLTP